MPKDPANYVRRRSFRHASTPLVRSLASLGMTREMNCSLGDTAVFFAEVLDEQPQALI
jgi:hypothetical protein